MGLTSRYMESLYSAFIQPLSPSFNDTPEKGFENIVGKGENTG